MLEVDFVPGRDDCTRLTDIDTVTSCASEETLCRFPGARHGNGTMIEEHELGPSPVESPGPPFKVGDVILCNIPGQLWGMDPKVVTLQEGFAMEAAHPNYKVGLEQGATVWTNTREFWLKARWATGPGTQFAEDQDDPFADLRSNATLRMGSYGIHINAQHDALLKIVEAKAYAEAVKSDDASVPVHLWNEGVRIQGVSGDRRDKALDTLWKLSHGWFVKHLFLDCLTYLRTAHGAAWVKARHTKNGHLTEFGWDHKAIAAILWHSVHTSWFEFNAGSRLIFFCFPKQYQKMARDGVRVFFEHPGPTMWEAQPDISNPKLQEMAKEKILKVVKHWYLRMAGTQVKSYIKYFTVPKGEDDIRLVYDAMANRLNKCVWVPTFWLPTIDSLVRGVDKDSWMTDKGHRQYVPQLPTPRSCDSVHRSRLVLLVRTWG